MRVRNAFIYSTVSIAALAAATPSYAQTSAPAEATPEKTAEGEQLPPSSEPTNAEGQPAAETTPTESGGAIVVTGSRIRRDNFSTPQNIDVITRDDQVLAGARSTTDVLQSGSVTSGTSQISGSFLGFLSDNGQGANTVGLRGLGASRTLVLLNGRRMAPAGVGAQLIAADLNTLPTSVVQRIEILREGASSIYGSDAIAGVINVITDTEIDGITVDAYADIPEIGAGRTLRGSITAGKVFDRGHIMASFEYREDKGLEYRRSQGHALPARTRLRQRPGSRSAASVLRRVALLSLCARRCAALPRVTSLDSVWAWRRARSRTSFGDYVNWRIRHFRSAGWRGYRRYSNSTNVRKARPAYWTRPS